MRSLLLILALYLPAQSNCQVKIDGSLSCKGLLDNCSEFPNSSTIFPTSAKWYTLNRPQLWAGCGAAFASGAAWGLHEKTAHHWNEFHATFPNANPLVWNPDESWRAKYNNNDPEQGRVKWGPFNKPVQLTDAKHALATITQAGMLSAGMCVTIGEKRPWWHYALDLTLVSLSRSAGNYLTFNALYW